MIVTVTANPCIDKTVEVEQFELTKTNRVDVRAMNCAGKGINVARTCRALGEEALVTGFDFCDGASLLKESLHAEGILHELCDVKGTLRVCTKVFDKTARNTVEFNERGARVSEEDAERLLQKIGEVAKRGDFLTLSGSLPPGLSKNFYKRCVERVRAVAPHCRVVVDAEGEALLLALEAAPFLIKPNINEFEKTFDCNIKSIAQLDQLAREILKKHKLGMLCVSLGGDGAYLTDGKRAVYAPPAPVPVRSLTGAGDAMVAGLCIALSKGLDLADVLRHGTAASGATVTVEGTAPGSRDDFEALLSSGLPVETL